VIGRDALHAAIAADPGVALALLGRLAGRVRLLVERLDRLTAQSVPARLAALLLARSTLHAGLAGIVTDVVAGGREELHRVCLPDDYVALGVDEVAAHLRRHHRATLVAIARDGRSHVNPASGFRLRRGDEAVVLAESVGALTPLGAPEAALPSQARGRVAAGAVRRSVAGGLTES
jgi:hypothetical protein